MQIVPLPNSTSELPHYLPSNFPGMSVDFMGRTLLVIKASISPIFCKPPPLPIPETYDWDSFPFEVEVTGENFSNFKVNDFYEKFCHALSLTCNSAVQVAAQWPFLEKHELFNLNTWLGSGPSINLNVQLFGNSTVAGETQIGEAKRLYRKMITLDANVAEKLQIPIDRWIKSKTSKSPIDKVIDLGIAFESLYLSDIGNTGEFSFRLRLRASYYLGKDKEDRKELMKDFNKIYKWRSQAVHKGKLSTISEETEVFIVRAQKLCRDSIMKILEDGKFPDWNDLILGEESL